MEKPVVISTIHAEVTQGKTCSPLARLMQQTAEKPSIAHACSKHQYCVPSENRHIRFLVPFDTDLLTQKINGFPELIVEHFCVIFGNPSCICS